MPTLAETAANFDALEAQAHRLMAVYTAAGARHVAPAIIQPAGLMLDVVGEDLRARTYVFADADGNELCLRPDLTVPTCRLYLERHPDAATPARYCYNGPAFRYRPLDAPKGNPREFRQAGIEAFAETDRETADVDVLALTMAALRQSGLDAPSLRIGDIGLFTALLDALAMPERWRRRLRHQFWRPDSFRAELKRLVGAPDEAARRLPPELITAIDPSNAPSNVAAIAAFLDRSGLELQGTRSLAEIAEGVATALEDARTAPLPAEHAQLIEQYVAVNVPANRLLERLAGLARNAKLDIGPSLARMETRLQRLADTGIKLADVNFSADFGRKFEYYTGFVFELSAPELGAGNPVAGGGRYDSLLQALGAARPVPAVGAAIYTERLLSARTGARS